MKATNQHKMTNCPESRKGERGIGLIESIIGMLVLTIVLLAAGQLFRVNVEHIALAERARRADTQANGIMNLLAAYNRSSLPDGNPFVGKSPNDPIADGEKITLDANICAASAICDQLARIPQPTGTGSDYISVAWNQAAPTNGSILYYRAWRVTTIDPARGLRRINVVILPFEPGRVATDAIEPLAVRRTDVVQRQ